MKIARNTLAELVQIVTGDTKISPYRSGQILVRLFNEFGYNDFYEAGFPSRWKYTEERLLPLNGKPALRQLVDAVFDAREWIGKDFKPEIAAAHLNKFLKFDGYEIAQEGDHFKVREIGKVANPVESKTPRPPEKPQPLVSDKTLAALRGQFLGISTLQPQQRGYALERFLYVLFAAYKFNPRPSFRIVGEQIDGSIEFAHEVYLIEAKWQSEPIVQADLAVLDSRVSGHSPIGRGIFITVGCFSPDGITAHERLRPSAMIGIDGQDLYFVMEHGLPLDEVLRRKVRWLVETGRFHHPVREFMSELERHR
jgi:hypothetical protein